MSEETTYIQPLNGNLSGNEIQQEVNNDIIPATETNTKNNEVKSSDDDDEDDDFGNFSDASIEDDTILEEEDGAELNEEEQKQEKEEINQCLDRLFGPAPVHNNLAIDNVEILLDELIKEERPHVIYEQLFSGRLHTSPFIWKHSHIRSTMLQVLGIEDDEEAKLKLAQQLAKEKEIPLDDSLYIKLCQVIDADKDNNNGNTMILRDNFKYEYTPRFHQPGSLQEEQDKEEEKRIPELLNWNNQINESMTTEQLQNYHDQLCNIIDSQALQLKALNRVQDGLTNDKVTFENVVTNLSGHTQRLQRDEIALYNKKMGRKVTGPTHRRDSNQWKRFSWVGL